MTRDTAFLLDIVSIVFHLQETSRVSFTLQLQPLHPHAALSPSPAHRHQRLSATGHPPPLSAGLGPSHECACSRCNVRLGEQTIRDSRNQFLWKGDASLVYKRPLGHPAN